MGVQILSWEVAILVEEGRLIVKYNRDTLPWAVENGLSDLIDLYLVWRGSPVDVRFRDGVDNTDHLRVKSPRQKIHFGNVNRNFQAKRDKY